MNIVQQFNALAPLEQEALAQIVAQRGQGLYSAETPSKTPLILYGEAEVGAFVYYDRFSHRITSPAPVVNFIDVPV